MLVRRISILVFTIVLVSVTIKPDAQKETPLDDSGLDQQDLDRFDTDGDAKLSREEKEVMFEAITLEAFTGQKLSREDLRGMRRGRGFGGPRGGRGMIPPEYFVRIYERSFVRLLPAFHFDWYQTDQTILHYQLVESYPYHL